MHEATEKNLKEAFAGESQAHVKYLLFADHAEKEGKPNTARLFKSIAYAELVHAGNHLRALEAIKDTAFNLKTALNGEIHEVKEMYPVFYKKAQEEEEKQAQKTTRYALEAEKIHADMYKKAQGIVSAGNDIQLGKVYICPICGYTVENDVSETCPVCGAKSDIFKQF